MSKDGDMRNGAIEICPHTHVPQGRTWDTHANDTGFIHTVPQRGTHTSVTEYVTVQAPHTITSPTWTELYICTSHTYSISQKEQLSTAIATFAVTIIPMPPCHYHPVTMFTHTVAPTTCGCFSVSCTHNCGNSFSVVACIHSHIHRIVPATQAQSDTHRYKGAQAGLQGSVRMPAPTVSHTHHQPPGSHQVTQPRPHHPPARETHTQTATANRHRDGGPTPPPTSRDLTSLSKT